MRRNPDNVNSFPESKTEGGTCLLVVKSSVSESRAINLMGRFGGKQTPKEMPARKKQNRILEYFCLEFHQVERILLQRLCD